MVLDKIIKNKQEEIKQIKRDFPLNRFKSKLKKSNRNFAKAISEKQINLIAEIKAASPSKGILVKTLHPSKIARTYQISGASAISVLTDSRFFGGLPEFLEQARTASEIPVLRKDFIIDEYQVYESRYYGADAILLIASVLSKEKIAKFIKTADKYNMDCLVEVHDDKELRKALSAKARIIGINNRNLKTLKIDLNTTLKLVKKIPKDKIIVSESGFIKKSDVKKVKGKVNAILIGTSLMKSDNIKKKIKELMK